MNSYYEDDGMLTNTFLQCIVKGPAEIKKFFKQIDDKKAGTYKEPDYYLLGSAVDQLLTDPKEFDNIYEYQATTVPTESIKVIVDQLFFLYKDSVRNLGEMPDDTILACCLSNNFQNNSLAF